MGRFRLSKRGLIVVVAVALLWLVMTMVDFEGGGSGGSVLSPIAVYSGRPKAWFVKVSEHGNTLRFLFLFLCFLLSRLQCFPSTGFCKNGWKE